MNGMGHKDCFGSIKEVAVNFGQTITHTRPECRSCEEIRDCLRTSKQIEEEKNERDELRKQDLIAQIIDLSFITSNEIVSCLLEFLSRIYSSPLGMILFKNLLLFYEVPQNLLSFNLTIPISQKTMNLIREEEDEAGRMGLEEGFTLRIVLFQKSFPNQPKTNMGMIAYEVARTFVSDELGIKQILRALSDSETNLFKKMDSEARMRWLIEKWGFLDEFKEFKKERSRSK
jgi:hypothetical protein